MIIIPILLCINLASDLNITQSKLIVNPQSIELWTQKREVQ